MSKLRLSITMSLDGYVAPGRLNHYRAEAAGCACRAAPRCQREHRPSGDGDLPLRGKEAHPA